MFLRSHAKKQSTTTILDIPEEVVSEIYSIRSWYLFFYFWNATFENIAHYGLLIHVENWEELLILNKCEYFFLPGQNSFTLLCFHALTYTMC